MPRKSKHSSISNTSPDEVLNRQIDTTGNDPSPVVNALMSQDFIQQSNLDASQIALLLQQLVRGQDALLSKLNEAQGEILRLKENQARIDSEAIQRAASQKKEIEEILDRASKHKATGDKKDKIIAKGVQLYQKAKRDAVASQSTERLAFEKRIAAEPKEIVVSPGQLITTMQAGAQVARIIPEEVRIKHKVWYLQPGVPVEVPFSVAEQLRNRRKSQQETALRQEMLSKHMESSQLAEKWNKVDGSKTGQMPQ